MKVLLIEDNIQLSANIVRYLWLKWVFCKSCLDWEIWLYEIVKHFYDVVILDINLPKINWIDVLKKIRNNWNNIAVIILTSNSSKKDIINWLEAWADDYLTKPFDLEELLARINALYRRNNWNKWNIIKIKNYVLDIEKHILINKWENIELSNLEYNLIKYFFQNQNKVISRMELYQKVWGEFDWDIMFSKTVDVYIWYIRKKLDKNIISTIKSAGYILNN